MLEAAPTSVGVHVVPALFEWDGGAQKPIPNAVISPQDFVPAPPGTEGFLAEGTGRSLRESVAPLLQCEGVEIGPDSVGQKTFGDWRAHTDFSQCAKYDLIVEHRSRVGVRALID
jgi:hypothetical protein